ncbi:MarR family transcriptional regulator [Bacillus mangrovi]|uniref:MarR family transcriptional regulator n=1 Tax=Metabacillus mangrovi TaxID=1491830 RepID=A0A7X2S396_9BACI|nr:MarR family transcriptional regulator [Metabacillus mangrovi]MTH52849.1 MarR family transcriptional regulator [Metabacillus mangrovi]
MGIHTAKTKMISKMYRQIDEMDLLLAKYFRELSNSGLTYQQEQILLMFKKKETWTVTEIAGKLEVTKSAISQVLKVLEQQKYITRQKNPSNLRESFISLDGKGTEWSLMIERIEDSLAQNYFSKIEEEDLMVITRVFDTLIDELQKNK